MENNFEATVFGTRAHEPFWVSLTLKFLPRPIYVSGAVVGLLIIGLTFLLISLASGVTAAGIVAMTCGLSAGLVTAASFIRRGYASEEDPYADSTFAPTLAVFVLLVMIYSWTALALLSFFPDFFERKIDDLKYSSTLLIALISFGYTQVWGREMLKEHFGRHGGRKLKLTGTQAILVVGIVFFYAGYAVWLFV